MASRAGPLTALVPSLLLLAALPAAAQLPVPGPPGPYVIDLRGALGPFPKDQAFFPPVPPGTIVPSRGFGIDLGGHVYLMGIGAARLGIGLNLVQLRHTTSPPEPDKPAGTTTTPTPTPRTIPDVHATLTLMAPQVSLNFGSANGWSYLSAGMGTAGMRTSSSGTEKTGARESGRLSAINVGGGARWFRNRHMAFAFDVRFHLVSARAQPVPLLGSPKTTMALISAGLSMR